MATNELTRIATKADLISLPRLRPGIAEAITLCLYGAVLAWAVPFHEPWADEAQAWQIARSLPLLPMLKALRYEGHPGLWYCLLWVFSRLHGTYYGMHWFAAGIAFLGVAALLFAAPFPRFIKLPLPFTFYLAFQYAIVARSYVLAPLLLFLCAYLWRHKFHYPLLIALCLGLLANVALHVAVISGGLAVMFLIDLWLERREPQTPLDGRRFYGAGALLVVLYGIAIWTALPAKDASGAALDVRKNSQASLALSAQQSQLAPDLRAEPANRRSANWLFWKAESRLAAGLTNGLVQPFWVGCLFWLALAWKLLRTRKFHYLIPPFLFVAFCADVRVWFWHSGLMLLCVITLLWMTWPRTEMSLLKLPIYELLVVVLFAGIVLVQISWAEFAFRFDHAHDYAPSAAGAAFLRPAVLSHASIVEIGDDYLSSDLQPYFDHNIYLNQPFPFYWWSTQNPSKVRYAEILPQHPQIVIVEWQFKSVPVAPEAVKSIPMVPQLTGLGYRNTHTFCGGLVKPGRGFQEWDCELIFERKEG